MTEAELQKIETVIAMADASAAAAIAFAAINRIGDLGLEAGDQFGRLAEGAAADPDLSPSFTEGCAQIEEHLA